MENFLKDLLEDFQIELLENFQNKNLAGFPEGILKEFAVGDSQTKFLRSLKTSGVDSAAAALGRISGKTPGEMDGRISKAL